MAGSTTSGIMSTDRTAGTRPAAHPGQPGIGPDVAVNTRDGAAALSDLCNGLAVLGFSYKINTNV